MTSQQSQCLIDEMYRIICITNELTEKISDLHLISPDNRDKHDLVLRGALTDSLRDIRREHNAKAREVEQEYWVQNLYEKNLANQKCFSYIASELPDYIRSAKNLLDHVRQMYEEYIKFGIGASAGDKNPLEKVLEKEVWAFLGDPIEHDFFIDILHQTITLLTDFCDVAEPFEENSTYNALISSL